MSKHKKEEWERLYDLLYIKTLEEQGFGDIRDDIY